MKTAATLAAICAIALALRVVPPYHAIFRGGRVVFAGNDPWIHMRDADNIAAHWPLPNWFDPYRLAPVGEQTEAPGMDIAISGIALATHIPLDVVGAWFPAIAGALIPIPIFFFTRRLFGDAEAMVAALLIAVLPGSLLQRSLLGVTDHHVLEALLGACTLLFLAASQAVLAGIFLGLYLLTWARGVFLVFIIIAWIFGVKTAFSRSRPDEAGPHTRAVALAFAIALVMAAPIAVYLQPMRLTIAVLAAGVAAVLIADRLPRRAVLPFGIALVIAALVALPDLVTQLHRFLPSGGGATVGEVQPLFVTSGHFTLRPIWYELTTSSILMIVGFVLVLRERTPERRLLLVFAVIVTAATLAQVRFAYYMAMAAAVLAAVAGVRLLWRGMNRVFGALTIVAIVIYPNIPPALNAASRPEPGPTDGWLQTLDWMRVHTPEPFASPAEYFARHDSERDAPKPKYGVMVWTDYGWWVSRIARRPPTTNPTQVAVEEAAKFYLATNEQDALQILSSRDAAYAIVDRSMPMTVAGAGQIMSSQLEVMARWARENPSRYYELAWDRGRPMFVYWPDYYRTMAVHLFGYDGKAFTPSNSSYAVAIESHQIVDLRRFATYDEAAAFVATDPKRWRLAGIDPIVSCVPLAPLQHLAAAFVSAKHDVKVFETVR